MQKNHFYRNTDQMAAISERSMLQLQEMDYAAYKAWPNLTAFASDQLPEQQMENRVRNAMERFRQDYREHSERQEWKYPAARPFCEKKPFIEQSKLFQLFQDMPKCSLLHIHNAAALSTDGFISLLKEWIRDGENPPICIVVKPGGRKIPGTLCFQPAGGIPEDCVPLSDFLMKEGGEDVLKNLVSLSSVERTESIPYIWDEFNRIFQRTGELLENRRFYFLYHYYAFKEMIEDRIEYTELRCSFTVFTDQNEDPGNPFFQPWNLFDVSIPFLDTLVKAADAALIDWNKENQEERAFHFRVILTARRDQDILDQTQLNNQGDKILLKMDSAIVIMQNPRYKELVCGFDLVSEEDRGKTTYTLYSRGIYEKFGTAYKNPAYIVRGNDMLEQHPELEYLRIQKLDFYLHDGESLWAENDNMIDACIISRHRIGHGFNLCKFPTLVEKFRHNTDEKGEGPVEPFLEICPISNQMLRYYPDLRAHSAYELIKSGVQCVLGNDDPMILENPGLSYDFWEAYVGIGLDYYAIKGLVFNAYICEVLADGHYPAVGNDYVLNPQLQMDIFNKQYWLPFLRRADADLA